MSSTAKRVSERLLGCQLTYIRSFDKAHLKLDGLPTPDWRIIVGSAIGVGGLKKDALLVRRYEDTA
jgi:hypothetical protein